MLTRATDCGTGKHPNMNVETQIPLELAAYENKVAIFLTVAAACVIGLRFCRARYVCWLVGWLCLTSHRQRGHLETAPPFTVPCEGRKGQ